MASVQTCEGFAGSRRSGLLCTHKTDEGRTGSPRARALLQDQMATSAGAARGVRSGPRPGEVHTAGKPLQQEQGPHNTPSTCSSQGGPTGAKAASEGTRLPENPDSLPQCSPRWRPTDLSAEKRCPNMWEMGPLPPLWEVARRQHAMG